MIVTNKLNQEHLTCLKECRLLIFNEGMEFLTGVLLEFQYELNNKLPRKR